MFDDPEFIEFCDWYIQTYGTPPGFLAIMMYREAKASAALDKDPNGSTRWWGDGK